MAKAIDRKGTAATTGSRSSARSGSAGRNGGRNGGNTRVQAGAEDGGFWDRPALMNLVADLFFLVGTSLLLWSGVLALQRMTIFPLNQLIITRPLEQVSRAQLEYVAHSVVAGNFFTVNLESAQAALERLPWVRRADVRRRWPDGIEVTLEEHRAVARWTPLDGEPRFVNSFGEVFAVAAPITQSVPIFFGPDGTAALVLKKYQEFAGSLGVIGRKPTTVSLSPRQAWQLKLDDGVVLELGRDQARHPLVDRVNRFTNNYAAVSHRLHSVQVIDMRYPNGFALRANNS